MGLFDGMFGSKYEPLDEGSPAARWIEQSAVLAEFVSKANDRVEVIPSEGPLYAYVGKPPKAFGIVWFNDGERLDVRSAMERGLMSREAAAGLVAELGRIYETYANASRFEYRLAGHKVIVTPSEEMYRAVDGAITGATSS